MTIESAVHDLVLNSVEPVIAYEDLPAAERSNLTGPGQALIKRLVSEAPLSRESGVPVPRIEKILVDIVCDTSLFLFVHGAELYSIYSAAI